MALQGRALDGAHAGAFPFGPILAAGPCCVFLPGRNVYALAASAVFYLPGYRHFMNWVGCKPASRQNLAALLQHGAVAVTMGGIAEMCAPLPPFVA